MYTVLAKLGHCCFPAACYGQLIFGLGQTLRASFLTHWAKAILASFPPFKYMAFDSPPLP